MVMHYVSILGLKSTLFDFYVNHNPAKGTGKAYHSFTGKNDTVYIKGHGWGSWPWYVSMGRCGNGKAR